MAGEEIVVTTAIAVWVSPNFTDTLLSSNSVFQTLPG